MTKLISLLFIYLLLVTHASAQFYNILIDSIGNPNEVSIAINPKNVAQLVAGANFNYAYHSIDSGQTWVKQDISNSVSGAWGDPMILCDTQQNFYYFHLSAPNGGWGTTGFLDRIVCRKSTTAGATWTGDYFMGQNNQNKIEDKEWVCVNKNNNHLYCTWTEFDSYLNIPNGNVPLVTDSSRILFSKSLDNGLTWQPTIRINQISGNCDDESGTTEGAVPCVDLANNIYVSWSNNNKIYVDKSIDEGATWQTIDVLAATQPGGWNIAVPGFIRTNGLPIATVDNSLGNYNGRIYICWADTSNGTDNCDIFIAYSINQANNWSAPIKVNTDNGVAHQFSPWMTIDQATGYIYIVFYDRRNHQINSNFTDVYMAVSKDGGQSFNDFIISESFFAATSNVFQGDYINITAHNGHVYPAWTSQKGQETRLYTIHYKEELTNVNFIAKPNYCEVKIWPNPAINKAMLKLYTKTEMDNLCISILDINGNKLATIYSNNHLPANEYYFNIDDYVANLSAGLYLIETKSKSGSNIQKLVIGK
jgi:hypothetical protein